jgi:serine/threonine protein kinase
MTASFDQVVADIASGKRSFATVASHLITLIEEVHTRKLLVIDIKPDNFMVAPSGTIVTD